MVFFSIIKIKWFRILFRLLDSTYLIDNLGLYNIKLLSWTLLSFIQLRLLWRQCLDLFLFGMINLFCLWFKERHIFFLKFLIPFFQSFKILRQVFKNMSFFCITHFKKVLFNRRWTFFWWLFLLNNEDIRLALSY